MAPTAGTQHQVMPSPHLWRNAGDNKEMFKCWSRFEKIFSAQSFPLITKTAVAAQLITCSHT